MVEQRSPKPPVAGSSPVPPAKKHLQNAGVFFVEKCLHILYLCYTIIVNGGYMGIFSKQLLDVIEWKDDSKDTIVYRYETKKREEIMTSSTLKE